MERHQTSLLTLLGILCFTSCKKNVPNPPVNIESVTICSQVWMKKNLDVSKYRNGDQIPEVADPSAWAALTTGAWCYFNNDTANGAIYGKLYNWFAVHDPRGLAPDGWHVPSDAEWTTLTNCLGGDSVAGGKMKETGTTYWLGPNTDATNTSGFTGLPGGSRDFNGTFIYLQYDSNWWSSSETDASNAWGRGLVYLNGTLGRPSDGKQLGFYVRCIKD